MTETRELHQSSFTHEKGLDPGKRSPARTVVAVGALVSGLGAGGVGGWLLYDGAVRGRAGIEAAQAAYDSPDASGAAGAWETLVAVSGAAKGKILWGIGLAAGGVLVSGIGAVLAIPPRGASVALGAAPGGAGVAVRLSIPIGGGVR